MSQECASAIGGAEGCEKGLEVLGTPLCLRRAVIEDELEDEDDSPETEH